MFPKLKEKQSRWNRKIISIPPKSSSKKIFSMLIALLFVCSQRKEVFASEEIPQ
jgi:hypothetical protein